MHASSDLFQWNQDFLADLGPVTEQARADLEELGVTLDARDDAPLPIGSHREKVYDYKTSRKVLDTHQTAVAGSLRLVLSELMGVKRLHTSQRGCCRAMVSR
jgi:hypothetical protein